VVPQAPDAHWYGAQSVVVVAGTHVPVDPQVGAGVSVLLEQVACPQAVPGT
jgi:hypothetical protein